MTTSRRANVLPYAFMAAVITFMLLVALKLPLSRIDVPYTFAGDAVDKLAQIQNVAETGWLFHNDRLGYPFGYDRLDFPRFDSLNYAIMGPVAAVTGHAGTAMNLYFIAGFYLIAFAAFFCFRRLGLETGPAMLCALLYSMLPYHLWRGVFHLTNGAYFLVPFAVLVLVWIAQNRFEPADPDARRRWMAALALCVLLPLQMPYNGFFFALLCVIACSIAVASRMQWRTVSVTATILAALAATFVAEQVPGLLHQLEYGKNTVVAQRAPDQAELYALRLNQVLLPQTTHRVETLAAAKRTFDDVMGVPNAEFRDQYIGVLGVLGFLALLWSLVRAAGVAGAATSDLERTVRIAAVLGIAILLLAMSSGIGTLIAYWVTSKIRTYNRILPFFAFVCLLGSGWLLQASLARLRGTRPRTLALAAIGIVALFDVTGTPPYDDHSDTVAAYDRTQAYFADVEKRLGDGATVLQLPVTWYPEHPFVNQMFDYDPFKPFLLTRTLRFSYGVAEGRPGYRMDAAIGKLPAVEQIARAHDLGFDAILIDANAYAGDAARDAVTGPLASQLSEPPSISADRRWWLFPLARCCPSPVVHIARGTAPTGFDYGANLPALDFSMKGRGWIYGAGGWRDPEDWGMWSSGTDARLRLHIAPRATGSMVVTMDTRTVVGPKVPQRRLHIEANGQPVNDTTYTLDAPAQTLQLRIPAALIGKDDILDLHFIVTPGATPHSAGISVDNRSLGIGLSNLKIELADGKSHAE